ncbi:hypothetical protein IFR05_017045, partial [Cadophora sp. M221]
TGLCPAEDYRDFRELNMLLEYGQPAYSVEMHLPLTPEFALANLYPDEIGFRHPLEDGNIELLEDPFWDSGDPLAGLGRFGDHTPEVDQSDRFMWGRRAGERQYEIRQQIEARGLAAVVDEAQSTEMEIRSWRQIRKSKLLSKEESFENLDTSKEKKIVELNENGVLVVAHPNTPLATLLSALWLT